MIEHKVDMPYIDEMFKHEYTAVYKKDGRWVIAWVEEIPGVNTQGRTMKEARENLHDALTLVLEENRKIARRDKRGIQREKISITAR
ncbi:MAG: type II toxin-antitoxin system HicB family antitoxin [Candidatus Liptonbacteria bacterium]|nr:type II toxin-antitoxin system HicB family antitoxin [Candidatus Liptonbacteria bacterium]